MKEKEQEKKSHHHYDHCCEEEHHHHHDHEGCGCAMCQLEEMMGGHHEEECDDECCHEHHHHDHCCEEEHHHHHHDHEGCGCAMCQLEETMGGHHHEEECDDECCHEHHHHDHEGCGCAMCQLENPSQVKESEPRDEPQNNTAMNVVKISLAAAALLTGGAHIGPSWLAMLICLITIVVWGRELFVKAFHGLKHRDLDENVLMAIAVVAAFLLGENFEAIMVVLLYSLGEILEQKAVLKSRKDISQVINIRPQKANLLKADGSVQEVYSSKIRPGDMILVRAGERVPVDGVIVEGDSAMDQSALTGEAAAVGVGRGDNVLSGSVNLSGVVKVKASSAFEDSTASRMIRLVEESSAQKGKTEKVITRFAKIYTPLVILCAAAVAVLPPLIGGGEWKTWIMNSLVFLVASCPCALVISVPLGLYSGVGAISQYGILVKGTKFIEPLAKAKAIVMDKTGTITTGELKVSQAQAIDPQQEETFLRLTALAEGYSSHPIAQAIFKELEPKLQTEDQQRADNVKEIAGKGIRMSYNGKNLLCGSGRFLDEEGIDISSCPKASVYTAYDGELLGYVVLSDRPREEAREAVSQWKQAGIENTVMLTGDSQLFAKQVQEQCGIDQMHADLLPQDKLSKLKEIKSANGRVIFIGDGINDAPVLAAADVGVAMGLGTDAAIEAADAVLMREKLTALTTAIKISRKTMGIVYFNICFILLSKLLVFSLGAIGIVTMWMAVLADVGVSIITVLNSVRILKYKE